MRIDLTSNGQLLKGKRVPVSLRSRALYLDLHRMVDGLKETFRPAWDEVRRRGVVLEVILVSLAEVVTGEPDGESLFLLDDESEIHESNGFCIPTRYLRLGKSRAYLKNWVHRPCGRDGDCLFEGTILILVPSVERARPVFWPEDSALQATA